MSAESRAALEAALDARIPLDSAARWFRADNIENAARAHLASERSEAVAALERVREGMNRIRCEHDLHLTTWAILWQRVAGIVDGEMDRLREGTA